MVVSLQSKTDRQTLSQITACLSKPQMLIITFDFWILVFPLDLLRIYQINADK